MFWFCIVLTICLTILIFLLYSEIFHKVQIQVKENPLDGDLEIYYKSGRGPHCACAAFFEEAEVLAPEGMRIGIFYDDPKIVRETNLRWIIGIITAVNGSNLFDHVFLDHLERLRYSSFAVPRAEKAIVASHPYSNFVSLWLVKIKFLAKLAQFKRETSLAGRPTIEIFKDNRVSFILPLQNHSSYMPPELRAQLDAS